MFKVETQQSRLHWIHVNLSGGQLIPPQLLPMREISGTLYEIEFLSTVVHLQTLFEIGQSLSCVRLLIEHVKDSPIQMSTLKQGSTKWKDVSSSFNQLVWKPRQSFQIHNVRYIMSKHLGRFEGSGNVPVPQVALLRCTSFSWFDVTEAVPNG